MEYCTTIGVDVSDRTSKIWFIPFSAMRSGETPLPPGGQK